MRWTASSSERVRRKVRIVSRGFWLSNEVVADVEWAKNVFTSPSIAYASHPLYAKHIKVPGLGVFQCVLQIKQREGEPSILVLRSHPVFFRRRLQNVRTDADG